MPELPEVESICQGLRNVVQGKTIVHAEALTSFSLRQKIPSDIIVKINNSKILEVIRRAKYIQIFLDNDIVLIIHLGMSGKILIKEESYNYQKHDHFAIKLDSDIKLIYNDPRRFGLIVYTQRDELYNLSIFKTLGVEPLSAEFTPLYLTNILAKKQQPIKLTLMDNANIVGIGNIYAAESLFLSGISPLRSAKSLNENEIILLHSNIIKVLENAIKAGGSTLKDYSLVNGEKGYFQNSFYVYGKEKESCKVCSNIILRIKQAGRASFYCDNCQK